MRTKEFFQKAVIFLLFFSLCWVTNAQEIITTNSDNVKCVWKASSSEIEKNTDTSFYKTTKNAIIWQWNAQEKPILEIQGFSANTEKNERSTFTFWVYQTKPSKEKLTFQLIQDKDNYYTFEFGLDFQGWRAAWLNLRRDTEKIGNPKEIKEIKIEPQPSSEGKLYWEDIRIVEEVNPRSPMQDTQLPLVNQGVEKSANAHWSALYYFSQFPEFQSQTNYSVQDLQVITQREKEIIIEQNPLDKNTTLESLRKEFERWNIQKKENYYTGIPITTMNDKEILPKESLPNKNIKAYTELMLQMALKKEFSTDTNEQQQLTDWFLTMLQYMHEQGWAYGSGMGALHHLGYNFQGYYASCLLMKEEIRKAGLLSQTNRDMYWFSGLGRIYEDRNQLAKSNLDVFNTILNGMLCSVLMSENTDQEVQRMDAFSSWLSLMMLPETSIKGAFKPDGAVVHHGTLYPAYGIGGVRGLSEVVYALHGTDFQVSKEAFESFKKVLLTMHHYANPRHWPISLAGRHPTGNFKVPAYPFLMAARSVEGYDKELASAYMLIKNKPKDQWTKKFESKGIQAQYPTGHWNVNYGLLDIHRRKDWLLTIRGHNRYFVTHESYPNQNMFGRFLTYGHLEVLFDENKNQIPNHFQDKGWDWSLIPGTTTLKLPIDAMRANIINADDYSGVEEMLISDEVFAGGVNLNDQGMFAMKLHGHDKYNMGSFWANKSWFLFDDVVIALGSNIRNERTDAETHTTLFQNYLGDTENSLKKSGEWIQQKCWLRPRRAEAYWDSRRIGYLIPDTKELQLSVGKQTSRDQKDKGVTEGYFETLTFNHGKAPKDGAYEYVMKIDTDKKDFKSFIKSTEKQQVYEVLQKDEVAHGVNYKPLQMQAFAIFEALKPLHSDLVQSVDVPTLLMYQNVNDGYEVSVLNPDIGFYQGNDDSPIIDGKRKEVSIYSRKWYTQRPSPTSLSLTLKGTWEVHGEKPKGIINIETNNTNPQTTKIQLQFENGIPVKFSLQPKL